MLGGGVGFVLLKALHFQGSMFLLLQITASETYRSCTDELHNSVNCVTDGLQWHLVQMFQTGVKLWCVDSHFLF